MLPSRRTVERCAYIDYSHSWYKYLIVSLNISLCIENNNNRNGESLIFIPTNNQNR